MNTTTICLLFFYWFFLGGMALLMNLPRLAIALKHTSLVVRNLLGLLTIGLFTGPIGVALALVLGFLFLVFEGMVRLILLLGPRK